MRAIVKCLVLSCFIVALCCPTAFADDVYAALHGTVTDTTGAVVGGARVLLVNTRTGIATERATDPLGYYVFPQLQPGGPYTVTISAENFSSFVASRLMLNVNDATTCAGMSEPKGLPTPAATS